MALLSMNLRLEATDGSGGEEYRIHGGDVEVRKMNRSAGEADPKRFDSDWQRLTPGELAGHVHGNTVVAQWLKHRIGWRRLLLKCTDRETLREFGIESPADRYAA